MRDSFYTWVKNNIHRKIWCRIPGGSVVVSLRRGHYNEDGDWITGAYLMHWHRRNGSYPYQVETKTRLIELVRRMRDIKEPGEWTTPL